jgi:hypothetical protein
MINDGLSADFRAMTEDEQVAVVGGEFSLFYAIGFAVGVTVGCVETAAHYVEIAYLIKPSVYPF